MKYGVLLLALLLPACGEQRQPTAAGGQVLVQVTYQDQVKSLLDKRCVRCHRASQPAGNYDLSSYIGVLEPGTDDVHNAIAGDASSKLLTKLDPSADPQHWGYLLPSASELAPGQDPDQRRQADRDLLRHWVVEDKLAYFDVPEHPPGWLYAEARGSDDFHGGFLRSRDWNFDSCRICHGADLTGGSSGKSCFTCHQDGPEGCTTCHGKLAGGNLPLAAAPPVDLSWSFSRSSRGVGAHQPHLGGNSWWAGAACPDCHQVPSGLRSPGHVGNPDFRAQVSFSGRAAQNAAGATYDRDNLTCAGVYCHGAPLADPTAKRVDPKWTDTPNLGCTSCHGMPGKGIGGPECQLCHQQSVAACQPGEPDCVTTGKRASDGKEVGVRFIDRGFHLDGVVPIGKTGSALGACDACHGTGPLGAPPPDVHGETAVTAPGVGAHAAHLQGGALFGPVACGECHVVPKNMLDKGHIDHDLPAVVTFGPTARGQTYSAGLDTKPTYDQATRTCKNVYCHALGGAELPDRSWNVPSGISCTQCHGQPPTTLRKGGNHPATGAPCQTCHGSAYLSNGQLDPTKHANGRVDL